MITAVLQLSCVAVAEPSCHRQRATLTIARSGARLLWKRFGTAIASLILFPWLAIPTIAQPNVHVDASMPSSPRPIESQTERAVVRDYLQSWKAMDSAFDQNRPDLLAQDFIGGAAEQLSGAIKDQSGLGIRTRYQDISHDIRFVFYSPEGMSIEFTDVVKFNVQVFDHGRLISSKVENARYLVVMTPSEVRWSIRIFQATQA
jgi:hypothetical protein